MQPQDQLTSNYGGQQNLPNATTSLVLGIISIVAAFIGIVLGIIGIILANRDRKLYHSAPGLYTSSSYSTSNAGRICSIIGIALSVIYIIGGIAMAFYFIALAKEQGYNR